MFLKSKIALTILSLYEIVAILLLHCPNTCNAMFGMSFCADSVLKYFIWCVAIPLLVLLVAMWIMELVESIRRRHSLLYKAKHAVKHMAGGIRDRVARSVSSADMEKMITAALVIGLKKYSSHNPRARRMLNEMTDGEYGNWDVEYDEYEMDDDENENPQPKKSQTQKRKK